MDRPVEITPLTIVDAPTEEWTPYVTPPARSGGRQTGRGPAVMRPRGGLCYPWDPREDEIEIGDIALSLSRMNRYNGNYAPEIENYSVAEHCCHMFDLLEPHNKLWGLLHEAAEPMVGDIIAPIKARIPSLDTVELKILEVVARKFGLAWPVPERVKILDRQIMVDEMRQICPAAEELLGAEILEAAPYTGLCVQGWSSRKARSEFLHRFSLCRGVAI